MIAAGLKRAPPNDPTPASAAPRIIMSDAKAHSQLALGRLAAMSASATFDESRLAKPSDWAMLDDDSVERSVAELSSGVDAVFKETQCELVAEQAGTLASSPPQTTATASGAETEGPPFAAQLVLKGLGEGKADLNGRCVEIHSYDREMRTWQVGERGSDRRIRVKASALGVRVRAPPLVAVTIEGLQRQPELNGLNGSLLVYHALTGRFAVEVTGKPTTVLLKPANLRDGASGTLMSPPVEVADGPHCQKLLIARRRFSAGQVIFEEDPAVHWMTGPSSEGVGQFEAALASFCAVQDEATRAAVLALHHNDAVIAKSGRRTSKSALGGGSDGSACAASGGYTDHDVERTALSGAEFLAVMKMRGAKLPIPAGQEGLAATFALIWDANMFTAETGSGIYLLLSRINHSCAPSSVRLIHGARARLVALRTIEIGEEITHSYLRSAMLLEPHAMRAQRLQSWFPTCWCARCASEHDDARCFRCSAAGCNGVCIATRPSGGADTLTKGAIAPCSTCGAARADTEPMLRVESQIVDKYLGFERGHTPATEKGVETLLKLAQTMLSPRHWASAAVADLGRDMLTQVYYWPPGMRAVEQQRRGVERAATLYEDWCACWRATLPSCGASVAVATKLEKCGDLLTVVGKFAEAVAQYLAARSEVAVLGMQRRQDGSDCTVERIERKLRAALKGQRNDEDLLALRQPQAT